MNGHTPGERLAWLLAAAVLALGTSTGLGGATSSTSQVQPVLAADTSTALQDATSGSALAVAPLLAASGLPSIHPDWPRIALDPKAATTATVATATAGRTSTTASAPKPTTRVAPPKPPAPKAADPKPSVWWKAYHGISHVWMPTLGVSKPVYLFPCSRGTDPDNLVYRWGCAGTNNVYLLGHAYGVFKALHDAYYDGKLKVGMPVVYADGSGRVRLYRVTTWRIVSPADAAWAIASQSVPSMTLQTCVGATGQLRLNVRLVLASH